MPARDAYCDSVSVALRRDGWTVTHDPLRLLVGKRDLFIDLAAERLLAAEREGRRVAVEVKSFLGPSEVADLQQALGQYAMYNEVLQRSEPDRVLYLAVTEETRMSIFSEPLGAMFVESGLIKLLVFDPGREEIVEWIPQP
jgi:hypothetical protein